MTKKFQTLNVTARVQNIYANASKSNIADKIHVKIGGGGRYREKRGVYTC
jgi:hypothetical protein